MKSPAARLPLFVMVATTWAALLPVAVAHTAGDRSAAFDLRLQAALARQGFTGRIESTLEQRIGRRIDHGLADLAPATPTTATSSAPRHSATWRFSRRSFTTARSHGWRTRCAIMWMYLSLAKPVELTDAEFDCLVEFVRDGLLDQRARPENLRKLIPKYVPSGFPVLTFE